MSCDGQSKSEEDGVGDKSNTLIDEWSEILVTGELRSNAILDRRNQAWLGQATYTREVFRLQDHRLTLRGSIMRFWQFDRSGSSGSSSFDINDERCRFIYVMISYFLMNNAQLGHDSTIQQSNGKRCIQVTRADQIERLFAMEEVKKRVAITGQDRICWRAYCDGSDLKEPLVVEDSRQYEERPEEGDLIKETTSKGE